MFAFVESLKRQEIKLISLSGLRPEERTQMSTSTNSSVPHRRHLIGTGKQRVKSSTQPESNNQVVSPTGAEVQKKQKSKRKSKIIAGVKNQKIMKQTDEGKR